MSDQRELLKPYEAAARMHCKLTGVDPDEVIRVPHPTLEGVTTPMSAWVFSAERLLDLSTLLCALKMTAQLPGAANDANAKPH